MPDAPSREPLSTPLFTPRFWGMWAFSFVTFFSAFQLLPVIPFRILALGGTTAQAGWFLAVYTFASAFSAPAMGSLADHFGRRRTLLTASLLFIVFSVAYGGITSYAAILADQRHVTPRAVYLTTMAVAVIVIRLATSHLGDRLGHKVMLYPSLLLVPVAFVLLALAHTRLGFIASAAIFGGAWGTA